MDDDVKETVKQAFGDFTAGNFMDAKDKLGELIKDKVNTKLNTTLNLKQTQPEEGEETSED